MLATQFNWFSPWLLASALAHGLLGWLLLQPTVPLSESPRPSTATTPLAPKIVSVFAISALPRQAQVHPPAQTPAQTPAPPGADADSPPDITPAPQPRLSQRTPTAPVLHTPALHREPASSAQRPAQPPAKPPAKPKIAELDASQRLSAAPKPAPASTTPLATTDVATILANVALQTAQRPISSAEIRSITGQPQADARPGTLRTQPNNLAGRNPSTDVLQTFQDGSQLVRVGKNCVLAALGAELRKDIHSMKTVPCDGTETDRINAHFEQVMSTVGRQR